MSHPESPKSSGLTDTSSSKFVKLHSVGVNESKWVSGFWAERFAQCRDVMMPTMQKLMADTDRTRYVGNFEVAIGAVEGKHRGPKWNDGDFYKWFESAASVLSATHDEKLDKQLDEYIDLIARTQDDDGYIHTDVQIAQKTDPDFPRFGNPMDFEMYNHGHLMSAACMHHRATGKTSMLTLAKKAADFLDKEFANPTPAQARHGICPSHLMGLVELYRATHEKRYIDLAVRLLNMRDLVTRGDDDNQDRVPYRQQRIAHGHAVRATYLYAGAADIYAETGDREIYAPLEPIWNDLVTRKLYITGGCGALFDGASPDGVIDQENITRVHQAFGRNYQLPQSTAHNETCAAIGNVLWSWRMLQITGEAKYADLVEQTLYNSVLAGVDLDGTAFFYTNTLRQLNPMPVDLRWPQQRQKTMSCFCCPPNVVRTVAEVSNYAYLKSDRGVSCVLYGGSTLDTTLANGTRVKLKQETNYPWDGKIRITIESAGEFSLMLRIPAWANDASVVIPDVAATPASPHLPLPPGEGRGEGASRSKAIHAKENPLTLTLSRRERGQEASQMQHGFREIRRKWNVGDVVELSLPMPVQLIEANPFVEEARNHVAIMRGPIVYCLESVDLPAVVKLMDVLIPHDAKFELDQAKDLLPNMVALKTRAKAIPSGDWNDSLYRDASKTSPRDVDIRLIPYFAWDNRGQSEMSVWLPVMR